MSSPNLRAFIDAMAAEPWHYDYFAALRWLDASQPTKPRLGTARRPADEPVRLGQPPEASFAPATLHAVDKGSGGRPPRIEVRFFGLFGPNGPLPLHLTDYARTRILHHGDHTFARFADLFHHRMLLLFYRAWAQAQPVVGLDRPGDDRFADMVGSLIGIGRPQFRGRDAAPDHVKLHFAGLFTRHVRNADGLANVLSGYLRRRARVEPFAGHWMALQEDERSRLGQRIGLRRNDGARLGQGAVAGRMVWDRQHAFRVHIGPMDLEGFEALLPSGTALPAVMSLVQQYVGYEFEWDLLLGLDVAQLKPAQLGRYGRLGWTTWAGKPPRRAVAELRLSPEPAMAAWQRRRRTGAPHPSY